VTYTVAANFGIGANGTYSFSLTGASGTNSQAAQFSGLPVLGAIVTVAGATSTPTSTQTLTITPTPAGNTTVVVYPNPVMGNSVNILPPAFNGSQDVQVEIFTLSFRGVLKETFPQVPSGTAVKVDLTDHWNHPMADGLYYVVVTVNGNRSVGKLLILR